MKSSQSTTSEDYKEWFDRFDNHLSPNLTVADPNVVFDSDDEDDFLNIKYDSVQTEEISDICMEESRDVSVSVTLNLRNPRNQQVQRRVSIVPSTEDQQQSYVSILHPESFTENVKTSIIRSEQQPQTINYNEWIKKIVDHQSSHLSVSDSDSDSDVTLDEISMLPLFLQETQKIL